MKFSEEYSTQLSVKAKEPAESQKNSGETKGGETGKSGGLSIDRRLTTVLVKGDNFKSITKSTEGVLLHSVTMKDDISYQYAPPGGGSEKGAVWKRERKQMPGMGGYPTTWSLDPNEGYFPQFIRSRKIVYVKVTDGKAGKNGIYDVCFEDKDGNRSLLSFDSSMNFLPIRSVKVVNKDYFVFVAKTDYEEKSQGFGILLPEPIKACKKKLQKFKT